MAYIHCEYCGAVRDTSSRYTSPANALKDAKDWAREHESGECSAVTYQVHTISSIEALDALPEDAAIVDAKGEAYMKSLDTWSSTGYLVVPSKDIALPAVHVVVHTV